MKKTFRFLALSFALICGTLSSFAAVPEPTNGPGAGVKVGQTVGDGFVVYKVIGWNGSIKKGDAEVGAYEVQITGLNWKGIQTLPTQLPVKLAFQEMYGEEMCNYVVTSIIDTDLSKKEGFYAQDQLTKVEFLNDPDIVNPTDFTVGSYSFYGCDALETLIFPNNVSSINAYAFQNTAITNFTIPANCISIAPFAFYNCKSLNRVEVGYNTDKDGNNVGAKLTELRAKVFANSTLHKLDLSNAWQLTKIGETAAPGETCSPFLYNLSSINDQLQEVILPAEPVDQKDLSKGYKQSKVDDVYNSFKNCTALATLTNLDITSIVTFEKDAFQNCESLTQLDFPVGKFDTNFLTGSPLAGCTSLATLTFAADFWGKIGDGLHNLYGSEEADLAALETITFKGFLNGKILQYAFGSNSGPAHACSSLATLTITKGLHGGNDGTNSFGAEIDATAFANCLALETVNLNGVTVDGDKAPGTVSVGPHAFAFTGIKNFKLGNVTMNNSAADGTFTFGGSLPVVISEALESVEIGTITIDKKAHVCTIAATGGTAVFIGGEDFTKFTVGAISNNGGTVNFGDGTLNIATSSEFASPSELKAGTIGSVLEEVKFGNIATSKAVNIKKGAFQSNELTYVKFGNLTKKEADKNDAELISIEASAFAVKDATKSEVVEKKIEIGNIAATVNIAAGAFTGADGTAPALAEETVVYTATLGNIAKAKDSDKDFTVTIGAKAFEGPKAGEVAYTIGDVNASMSAVAAEAFVGATDGGTTPLKNAVVTIGAMKQQFVNTNTFTRVKSLTVASWEAESNVNRFQSPYSVTVTGNTTQKIYGDAGEGQVKEISLLGDVTKEGALTSFGNAVRQITFGKDKNVVAKAVAAKAFEEAANKAETAKEVINVTYQCTQNKLYNPIFVETSFGTIAEPRVVTLYTTEWAKNNIFENTSSGAYPNGINRLTLSSSEIVPGENAVANVVAAKNGQYKYGKLFIPKGVGLKYKIDAEVSGSKNGVNVFSGHLDNDHIYMKQIDVYDGYYWIDATEADQVFVVRTSDLSATTVEAEFVDDPDELTDPENLYWFNKNDAMKNCLRYNPAKIVNQELQNNAEFKHQTIYMMANPAKYNLAFAKLNQYISDPKPLDLPAKSIYVVSPTDPQASAGRLTVIFEDEIDNVENTTGIETIEEINVEKNAIYNLQGVRVNKAQKGIYIINGRKVVK